MAIQGQLLEVLAYINIVKLIFQLLEMSACPWKCSDVVIRTCSFKKS